MTTKVLVSLVVCVGLLASAGEARASADGSSGVCSIALAWDANPEPNIQGYVVKAGTAPDDLTETFDVGNQTTFEFDTAVEGIHYYFAVKAYTGIFGPESPVVDTVAGGNSCTNEPIEWFVAPGGDGGGTSESPWGSIQQALDAVKAGDTITVRAGTYRESLRTAQAGTQDRPIRLRGENGRGSTIITFPGQVLSVGHDFFVVEDLVLDGQYGAADTLAVKAGGNFFTLLNSEVRRSSRHLIQIDNPLGVLIEKSLIHHALNPAGGRTDAHGVSVRAARSMTIRETEIHTFSGDGIHISPDLSTLTSFNRLVVEGSRIWLEPLAAATNGFAAGVVPGDNAFDTDVFLLFPALIDINNTDVWGFQHGLVANMSAFNLKQNMSVTFDGVTVHDSEIAFRVRGFNLLQGILGSVRVTVKNAVIHDTTTAFRYENNIDALNIWNGTIGGNVVRAFERVSGNANDLDVRNLLVLGPLPSEATDGSNRSVAASAFVNAAADNYALPGNSPAIDAGDPLAEVAIDRVGQVRPQGSSHDVGAYEGASTSVPSDDVVVYATTASMVRGAWQQVVDASAAGGARLAHADEGAARAAVLAAPVNYFEVQMQVEAGRPYRLWLRGRADGNSNENDSVYLQFSGAVGNTGAPKYRIGTTSSVVFSLRDCSGCALVGWGWQDNKTGLNVLGPTIRFAQSGLQTIRIQTREDGMSIDQIVLSPTTYLSAAPGAPRNDATILPES